MRAISRATLGFSAMIVFILICFDSVFYVFGFSGVRGLYLHAFVFLGLFLLLLLCVILRG